MVCILIRPPGDSEAHKSVRSSLLGLGRSEHGKSIVIIKDFLFISLLHHIRTLQLSLNYSKRRVMLSMNFTSRK